MPEFKIKILSRVAAKERVECPMCHRNDGWIKAHHDKFNPEKVVECKYCKNVSGIDFVPFYKQLRVLYDSRHVLADIGGVGTGKTELLTVKKTLMSCLVPNALGLFTSGTLQQLKETTYDTMLRYTPPKILAKTPSFNTAKSGSLDYINGRRILFYPASDEKLRSLNLMDAHIEEASSVDVSVYKQLLARLRQSSAESGFLQETKLDKRTRELIVSNLQITVTTNPEDNWVIDQILYKSAHVRNYTYFKAPEPLERNQDVSCHIAPSAINPYLPKGYIESQIASLDTEEERRSQIGGDFNAKAGRVVPDVEKYVVSVGEVLENNYNSFSIYGLDFGEGGAAGDPQSFLELTFVLMREYGRDTLKMFVTRNHYCKDYNTPETYVDTYLNIMYRNTRRLIYKVVGDNIDGNKGKNNDMKVTKLVKYADLGLPIEGAKNAMYTIDERAHILRAILESGALSIDVTCVELIKELKGYTREKPKIKSSKQKTATFKGADHGIDSLMFALLEYYEEGRDDPVSWYYQVRQQLVDELKDDMGNAYNMDGECTSRFII